MNIQLGNLSRTQLLYIILAILVVLYAFKIYKKMEKFDQPTLTKIDNVIKALNKKEFRDYLIYLNNQKYFDEKLGKYESYVYLRKLLMDKKLTREELITYFD